MKYYGIKLLLVILSILPFGVIECLGTIIGRLLYLFSSRWATRLRQNLLLTERCNESEVDRLALRAAIELGKTFVETAVFSWQRGQRLNARFVSEVRNFAIVQKLAQDGCPILFLTPHIGNFEIALKYTALQLNNKHFTVLYKPSKKGWLDKMMFNGRVEDNVTPVPTTRAGVMSLVKALKDNEAVGILPDNVASGDGVWANFFGKPVFATTLAAKLALLPRVKTFMVISTRKSNGFIIDYIPVVPESDNIEQIVAQIYKMIESKVALAPEQYYWSYDRFRKHKPDDIRI